MREPPDQVSPAVTSGADLNDYDLFPDPDDRHREPKPCRRHDWGVDANFTVRVSEDTSRVAVAVHCLRCAKVRDDAAVRRGKNNKGRGLAIQREVARAVDMENIAGNGPADARDARFYAEIKSGPSWYSTRVEAELDNLPTDTGRTPVFIAASTPGPGHGKRRVYTTVTLGDLVKMVGPHVQVSMWAPEWVALKKETA
jgi:hypothetical protein